MEKYIKVLGSRGRITIPIEIRSKVGYEYDDILSFEIGEDDTVIIKKEKVCDCPASNADNQETLLDVLNRLSPEQQAAALVHLSILIAENQRNKDVEV